MHENLRLAGGTSNLALARNRLACNNSRREIAAAAAVAAAEDVCSCLSKNMPVYYNRCPIFVFYPSQ